MYSPRPRIRAAARPRLVDVPVAVLTHQEPDTGLGPEEFQSNEEKQTKQKYLCIKYICLVVWKMTRIFPNIGKNYPNKGVDLEYVQYQY